MPAEKVGTLRPLSCVFSGSSSHFVPQLLSLLSGRGVAVSPGSLPLLSAGGGRRSGGGVLEVLGAVLTLLSAAFILLTFPLTGWMCAQVIRCDTQPSDERISQ